MMRMMRNRIGDAAEALIQGADALSQLPKEVIPDRSVLP